MALTIIQDQPKERLVLQGKEEFSFLISSLTSFVLFILLFWGLLPFALGMGELSTKRIFLRGLYALVGVAQPSPSLTWIGWVVWVGVNGIVFFLIYVYVYHRWKPGVGIRHLSFDRHAQEVKIARFRPFRSNFVQIIPFTQLESLKVVEAEDIGPSYRTVMKVGWALRHKRHLPHAEYEAQYQEFLGFRLRIVLSGNDAEGNLRSVDIPVAVLNLKTKDQGVAFAHKLAGIVGFPVGHIFTTRQGQFECWFSRDDQNERKSSITESGEAEKDDLLANRESGAHKAYGLPPFDPVRFKADHRITHWTPGHLVRFTRPYSNDVLLLAFCSLLIFTAPLLWAFPSLTGRMLGTGTLVFIGVLTMALGGLALGAAVSHLPRSVEFIWEPRVMKVKTVLRQEVIPLDDCDRLILDGIKEEKSNSEAPGVTILYAVGLKVTQRTPRGTWPTHVIAQTHFYADPEKPYDMAVPLVRDLEKTLKIPAKILDYSGKVKENT